MAKEKISPGMQQYLDIKENYPDAFLLFRMGDFYELFYEDAVKAAQILEISLTSRNKNADNPIPMAGVPYHSAQAYIDVLVEMGYKVAIAEQMLSTSFPRFLRVSIGQSSMAPEINTIATKAALR